MLNHQSKLGNRVCKSRSSLSGCSSRIQYSWHLLHRYFLYKPGETCPDSVVAAALAFVCSGFYSACIVCSMGCSLPGTWCIPVGRPRFDQQLRLAVSEFFRRLCYSGPGSSLFQILTRPAFPLFGSSRHVSGVQPEIAYGECSRQVRSVPLSLCSIALIIPSTPSSSGLSLLLLLVTVHEQNLPLIPLFLSSDQRLPVQFVSRLCQVSQRLVRLIFPILSLLCGTAALVVS